MTRFSAYLLLNSIIKAFGMCLLLFSSHQSLANITLTYQSEQGSQTFQLKNNQVFTKNIDQGIDLLFDQNRNHMIVIQHDKQSYSIVNEAELERLNQQLNGLQSALTSNLSSEQRDQLNQFLGGALGSGETKKISNYSLQDAGAAQVGAFFCQQNFILENGKNIGALCTASNPQLKISQADYTTLMAFQKFSVNAANTMKDTLGSMLDIKLPDLSKTPINQLIIFSKINNEKDANFYLSNIDSKPINENFTIPNNYRQESLVSASSLIR